MEKFVTCTCDPDKFGLNIKTLPGTGQRQERD